MNGCATVASAGPATGSPSRPPQHMRAPTAARPRVGGIGVHAADARRRRAPSPIASNSSMNPIAPPSLQRDLAQRLEVAADLALGRALEAGVERRCRTRTGTARPPRPRAPWRCGSCRCPGAPSKSTPAPRRGRRGSAARSRLDRNRLRRVHDLVATVSMPTTSDRRTSSCSGRYSDVRRPAGRRRAARRRRDQTPKNSTGMQRSAGRCSGSWKKSKRVAGRGCGTRGSARRDRPARSRASTAAACAASASRRDPTSARPRVEDGDPGRPACHAHVACRASDTEPPAVVVVGLPNCASSAGPSRRGRAVHSARRNKSGRTC